MDPIIPTHINTGVTVKESAEGFANGHPRHDASTSEEIPPEIVPVTNTNDIDYSCVKDADEINVIKEAYFDRELFFFSHLDERWHEEAVERSEKAKAAFWRLGRFAAAMAIAQSNCFKLTDLTLDLYRATFWGLKAVTLSRKPFASPHLPVLIVHLGRIFNRYGRTDDVMVIIARCVMTLLKREPKVMRLHELFRHLSKSLLVAYRNSPRKARLEAALRFATAAASITWQEPSLEFHHLSLGILADVHHTRHQRFDMSRSEELEKAITYARQAVGLSSHPDNVRHYFRLSDMFRSKYFLDSKKHLDDLNQAVGWIERAMKSLPEDSSKKPFYSFLHGRLLLSRYLHRHPQVKRQRLVFVKDPDPQALESIKELDQAIVLITKAEKGLEQISPSHPRLPMVYGCAGEAFGARYWAILSRDDLTEARTYYQKAMDHSISPVEKISYARAAAKLHLRDMDDTANEQYVTRDHAWARDCLSYAIMLLPRNNSWVIPIDDQQFALSQLHGLPAEAVAVTLSANPTGNLQEVLRLLEVSRGVIIGSSIALRGLKKTRFDKYKALHDASMGVYTTALQPDNHSQNEVVAEDDAKYGVLESVLSDIRQLPGFHDFLSPPRHEDMEKLVEHGGAIVVFNAAETRSDAIVMISKKLKHIPLPKFKLSDIEKNVVRMQDTIHDWDMSNRRDKNIVLRSILKWLWISAVKPVCSYLETVNERDRRKRPTEAQGQDKRLVERIWWIGVGLLSKLPFHAAGVHGIPGKEKETVIHRFRSSYIPTIKALAHAVAASSSSKASGPKGINLSMIHMKKTPGYLDLTGVEEEVKAIASNAINYGVHVQILHTPSKKQVVNHFRDLKRGPKAVRKHIIHFSCHGISDLRDPLDSHVVLANADGSKLDVKKGDTASSKLSSFVRGQLHLSSGRRLCLQQRIC
ncbi:hypothetical protein CPC08DRAFT_411321 [Agrocybe pediades]|nr:hypothetical protein CPC08DRAFT_411321 [Agrocybe pediades]